MRICLEEKELRVYALKKRNYAYMHGKKGITHICMGKKELRVYDWKKRKIILTDKIHILHISNS